jgi:hypothetical protein
LSRLDTREAGRSTPAIYLTVVCLVAIVAATACRPGEETQAPLANAVPPAEEVFSTQTAQQVLEAATSRLEQAGSAHFAMEVELSPEAALVHSFSYAGDFQLPDRSHGAIEGPLVKDTEIFSAGGTTYHAGGRAEVKQWDSTDTLPFFLDPVRIIMAALTSTGDLELVGEDVLDGTPVHYLTGTNPPEAGFARGVRVELEVWIGHDDSELKQVTVDGEDHLGAEGHPILGAAAGGRMRAYVTMKLSDFGNVVSIESPVPPTRPGEMAEGREREFTATLLHDGRVLVTGGERASVEPASVLRSAEIYDPSTGAWSSAGSMSEPRGIHTATLLPDGRVLVASGVKSTVPSSIGLDNPWSGALDTSELYDPATGLWTQTGRLGDGQFGLFGHVAALLPDGRVLIAGGWMLWGRTWIGSVQGAGIYDPATGGWSETATMSTGRANPSATLLPDGRVLVAGGADSHSDPLASTETYDPSLGAWSPTASMAHSRQGHWAALVPDGRVLVGGGEGGAPEVYDPSSNIWSPAGRMIEPRAFDEAVLLQDGRILAVGGLGENGTELSSAELFDPATNTWMSAASTR